MSATELFARRATLSRSVRLLSAVPLRAIRPGPVLHRARRGHRGNGRRPVAGDPSRACRRVARCSTSAAAPAISPAPSSGPGWCTSASSPTPREMHAGPRDRGHGHLRPGVRHGVAVRRRQRGHLPVVQRRRTRARPVAAGQRDAAGHQARRPCGAVVHGVARPVRRARDGVERTTSAVLGQPIVTRANMAVEPKNDYGSSLFAVSVADGLKFGRRLRRAGRRIPPLPPTMGVVDDGDSAAQGVSGEQSGAGPAPAGVPQLKQVLVLPDRG